MKGVKTFAENCTMFFMRMFMMYKHLPFMASLLKSSKRSSCLPISQPFVNVLCQPGSFPFRYAAPAAWFNSLCNDLFHIVFEFLIIDIRFISILVIRATDYHLIRFCLLL